MEAANNVNTPIPQVVGNVFVEQYYHILHTSPELVYRFYQEESVISRPDINGEMASATTMKGINEKILSLNFKEYKAEIKTADAQKSLMEGVTVLVTGCLTDKHNIKRKFAQSFFLAPQDNGYFVLNDVFRYMDDAEQSEPENTQENQASEHSEVSELPASERSVSVEVERSVDEVEAVHTETPIGSLNETVISTVPNENDAPKKSYASIVKVPKEVASQMKVYVPTKTSPKLEPEVPVPSSSTEVPNEGAENCHSIYIRNLPFSVSVEQLEEVFSKFGPIKHDGVQVRFNKQQGYCFGFIEFLTIDAMNKAIEASPLTIDGRQAVIEVKKAPSRVGGEKGRLPSGRQGFRADIFRGRGSYTGRGTTGRFSGAGDGYFHQSRGRGSRPGGPRQNPITP